MIIQRMPTFNFRGLRGANDEESFLPASNQPISITATDAAGIVTQPAAASAVEALQPNRSTPSYNTIAPKLACPTGCRRWYIFVLLGAVGGGLAVGSGFLIRDYRRKKR